MKTIPLTRGQFAMVDDSDYEWLNQWKWMAVKGRGTYYAARSSIVSDGVGRGRTFLMHRIIMNIPKGMECDHRNHNGLDNQRNNLRECTYNQNQYNKKPSGRSKYLGVTFNGEYIISKIKIGKKRIHLGIHKTEELAARAYDAAAKKYHGEFANLNFK